MHAVHADQDPEVIARETTLAWLDEDTLELVPDPRFPGVNAAAQLYVETFARIELHASVVWQGNVAEFTPDYVPGDGMTVDHLKDASGDEWDEKWLCDPPAVGVTYLVLEDEWNEDFTVRTIKKIEVKS